MSARRQSRMVYDMMRGGPSQQVMPISEEDEYYFDDAYEYDDESPEFSSSRKYRPRTLVDTKAIVDMISYENAKIPTSQYLIWCACGSLSLNYLPIPGAIPYSSLSILELNGKDISCPSFGG
eukprot:scaffold381_cov168-Ochromonas_danica.AAC.3